MTDTLIEALTLLADGFNPKTHELERNVINGAIRELSQREIPVITDDKALLAEILKEYGSALRMQTICKIRKAVKGF